MSKPAKELKWGKRALRACEGYEPADWTARRVLGLLRAGRTTRQIGEAIGRSDEMVKFLLRRLIERARAMRLRAAGRACLARNCPTAKQLEAIELLLLGLTECDVAERLHVTQAAVASRLKLGLRRVLGAPWAADLRAALKNMTRMHNVNRFQSKPRLDGAPYAPPGRAQRRRARV